MLISEALADGARHIEKHGWRQNALGIREWGEPTCLMGSMPAGHRQEICEPWATPIRGYVTQAIAELYGVDARISIASWNDDFETTKDMVLSVLRHAEKLAASEGD